MEDNETKKLIWDFPLRIFHWLLVFSVFGSILTGKFSNFQLHEKFGLNIIALLIFRIIWGFIGGETSKFTYFVKGPKSVIISLNNIIYKNNTKYIGHSAIGGWATIVLLGFLFAISITGSFSSDDVLFDGPFLHFFPEISEIFTKTHNFIEPFLYILLFLHFSIMLVYYFWLKRNLVAPMITGKSYEANFGIKKISIRKNIFGLTIMFLLILIPQSSVLLRDNF